MCTTQAKRVEWELFPNLSVNYLFALSEKGEVISIVWGFLLEPILLFIRGPYLITIRSVTILSIMIVS